MRILLLRAARPAVVARAIDRIRAFRPDARIELLGRDLPTWERIWGEEIPYHVYPGERFGPVGARAARSILAGRKWDRVAIPYADPAGRGYGPVHLFAHLLAPGAGILVDRGAGGIEERTAAGDAARLAVAAIRAGGVEAIALVGVVGYAGILLAAIAAKRLRRDENRNDAPAP